ncbi:hypothetical protein KM043_011426 [Ampulex compressa]|nr:hypothetical protein KM043_011426 [Ampulex compressa]
MKGGGLEDAGVYRRKQGGKIPGGMAVGWRFQGGVLATVAALISYPRTSFHLTTLTSLYEDPAVPQDLEGQETLVSWEMIPLCKERMEMTLGAPQVRSSPWSLLVSDDDDCRGQDNETALIKERLNSIKLL